jgi:Cu(I)/Ag(I) efflux system membrane fusion protein
MTQTSKNAWQVTKIVFLRLRFIMIFVVIGLMSWKWELIMNVVDKAFRPKEASVPMAGDFEWFCPMHPSIIRQDDKEKCPICGMPLSRRKRGEKTELPAGIVGRVELTPYRQRQAKLATEEIVYRTLVRELRTVGQITWDERRLARISARVAGRADELFINFTGDRVKKGDPVYKLYSPDLVTTQEEYLLAQAALGEIQKAQAPSDHGHDTGAVERARRLADSTRERMRLWGITETQIAELEKTRKATTYLTIASPVSGIVIKKDINAGHQVMVGEDPYTIADDSRVWMQADVFERDMGLVKVGQEVEITTEAYPGEVFSGTVAFIAPSLESQTRTVKVRVDVENPTGMLKEGMYVTSVLRIPIGKRYEVFYGC